MKYRLKKDLPFAKVGATVILQEYSTCNKGKHWVVNIDEDKRTPYYQAQHIGEESWDMTEWIEEVKPREWDVIVFNDEISSLGFGKIINSLTGGGSYGVVWGSSTSDKPKHGKVREVIE